MTLQRNLIEIENVTFGITDEEVLSLGSLPAGDDLVIGQERALKALVLGMDIRTKGFNIFVTGLPGTGKTSAVMGILKEYASRNLLLRDIAFVNNFRSPDHPRVLYFEPGAGEAFKMRIWILMESLITLAGTKKALHDSGFEDEIARIKLSYPDSRVVKYLSALQEDIVHNSALFRDGRAVHYRYGVNLIIDHSESDAAPAIFESYPDYAAIFGSQDPPSGPGLRADFMNLRAGALIRASGGFLILRAEDILNDEDAWNSLKRALQNGCTEIRPLPNPPYPVSGSLNPEPVSIDTKVIIVGNEHVYDYLYSTDEDFPKLFKVSAEFDSVMDRDEKGTRGYLCFCRKTVADEGFFPLTGSGMAAILEHGVRIAEIQEQTHNSNVPHRRSSSGS